MQQKHVDVSVELWVEGGNNAAAATTTTINKNKQTNKQKDDNEGTSTVQNRDQNIE